jgi:hypothetical protein
VVYRAATVGQRPGRRLGGTSGATDLVRLEIDALGAPRRGPAASTGSSGDPDRLWGPSVSARCRGSSSGGVRPPGAPHTSKRPFVVRMDAVVAAHLFGDVHDRNGDVDHLWEAER